MIKFEIRIVLTRVLTHSFFAAMFACLFEYTFTNNRISLKKEILINMERFIPRVNSAFDISLT